MTVYTLGKIHDCIVYICHQSYFLNNYSNFLIEQTQVCVQQTTLDLLSRGLDVHIVADGCSSRSQVDRLFALDVREAVCMPKMKFSYSYYWTYF